MPYSASHKEATRHKIVQAARELFNRHGFQTISIDEIMERAGLTRGGFYSHFKNKAALYAEAVASMRHKVLKSERLKQFTSEPEQAKTEIIDHYLSTKHRDNVEEGCSLPALVSDVSRESTEVRDAYTNLFKGLASILDDPRTLKDGIKNMPSDEAITTAVMCVGGQILSRAVSDPNLSDQILKACREELRKKGY